MIDKKPCPHCSRGRQTAAYAPRPYSCEDCGGSGEMHWCEYCEQWLDPGAFPDPDRPVCARCEDEGLHLRYYAEGLSVFDRRAGDEFVAGAFMPKDGRDTGAAYRAACEMASRIAELLNEDDG